MIVTIMWVRLMMLSCLLFFVKAFLINSTFTILSCYLMQLKLSYTKNILGSIMSCMRFAVTLAVLWIGFFHVAVVRSGGNHLYDCVLHIIRKYFPEECVCFFVDAKNQSSMFEKLIMEVGKLKSVYVVTPEDGEELVGMSKTRPIKPFPCYFILYLPYVSSNMTWSFLRGGYQHGDYSVNESRYFVVAEEHHTYQQAADVLNEMFSYGFLDIDLVNPDASGVEIFTLFPFGRNFKSCPERVPPAMETVATWRNGTLDEKMVLFPEKLPSGVFSGCSWNISCGFFPPYIITTDGGRFSGPMQGYDAGPLSLLMDRLNLTPEWTIHIKNFWITIHPNGSVMGAIPDLVLGRGAQMCCGGLYQAAWALGNTDPTPFHTWATMSWFVAAPNKVPKWTMIFVALDKKVWSIVIVTSTIVPIIYWIFCILSKRRNSLGHVFLTLTALGFSNSTGSAPVNISLRAIFISWLLYALHIDQFYLASLTRLITNAEYEPTIKTVDQLLESKLPTAAYAYTAKTLCGTGDPTILKLMENHITMTKVLDDGLNKMSLHKNFSIAENKVFVKYAVHLMNNVSVYPTEVNYQERPMSALMWRHNYLFDRINWLLLRMYDAGFPVYFLKRTVPNRFWTNPNDNNARAFNLRDLSGPFFILILGLFLSFLAFLGELIYFNGSRLFRKNKNLKIQNDNPVDFGKQTY